ncbi:MAG: RNA polymerase sigma factor [Bacteroidia bacterium]|nr:RNA polymerase sigma factor [Bacteroidia bacterium]
MPSILEHSVLEGCLKNNRLAQQQLYKDCFDFLIRICRRYVNHQEDAVDLLNQAFLKILNNLKNYKKEQSFEAWISTIAVNTAIDQIRKDKRYREKVALSEDYKVELFDYNQISINVAVDKMAANDIMKLIQQLPVLTREVLNLNVIEGYHHKEISQMLDISEEASRWHLHKARQILKEKLLNNNKVKVA